MMQQAPAQERLAEKVGRWKRALADAAVGPLIIAPEVMALAESWDSVKDEAGGVTCNAFLRAKLHPGRDIAFFRRRADAVAKLGEASRRTVHHEVAVWVISSVPEHLREAAKLELIRGAREQGGHPLVMSQARARLRDMLGASSKKKVCVRCRELEALLIANGVALPD